MIEVPYYTLLYPITVDVDDKITVCYGDAEVRLALKNNPDFRVRYTLRDIGIHDYEDFMQYTHNVIPYIKGIEDLSLMGCYNYPYYYEYEGEIHVSQTPEDLGQVLVESYKKQHPVTLLPRGIHDWRVMDSKYPKLFADYMHNKGIQGLDYFFVWLNGYLPFFYVGGGMAMRDELVEGVTAIGKVKVKKLHYPVTVKFGTNLPETFSLERMKALTDRFIEAYKNFVSFTIVED